MGTRYYLDVTCPSCGHHQDGDEMFGGCYYAPTCGIMTHKCENCGKVIDLEKYSGISAEGCANTDEGVKAVRELRKKIDEDCKNES